MTKHKPTLVRDPEVQPSSTRSTWAATQKLALLAEYEAFPRGSAERGAFLRRSGLYTSHMSKWRDLRDRGAKAGLAAQPRGPKPAPEQPLLAENIRLQQELARVQARLTHAEAVIEIQKKERSCLARCRSRRPRASRDCGRRDRACSPGWSDRRVYNLGGVTQQLLPHASADTDHAR